MFGDVLDLDLFNEVEPVCKQEINGINSRESKAERHRDTRVYFGHTQNVGQSGLIYALDKEKVVGVLCAYDGEHDKGKKLEDGDDVSHDLLSLAVHEVDDDVDAEMSVLAVGVCASDENRPDEKSGDDFLAPLKGGLEEVTHDDVEVNKDNARCKGRAGNDRVKVDKNKFRCVFFLHRRSLTVFLQLIIPDKDCPRSSGSPIGGQ